MIVAQTDRLILRRFAVGDETRLGWIYSDPDVMRFIPPGLPWDDTKIARLVAVCGERYSVPGFGMWAAESKQEPGKILGHCGLQHLAKTEMVEIAWIFGKAYWNKGLATEAARAVLAHGFERLGMARIVAVAEPPNGASLRIMQKIGMTLQGPVQYYDRDFIMYALDVKDYVAMQKAALSEDANQ
jgi:ribosomal-protein-alanine N-acetyltransferase